MICVDFFKERVKTIMEIFKNIEEMKPYYNEKTNTYEFIENGLPIDILINFDLYITSCIYARDINACDINACDINAWDINACDIRAENINANNIRYDSVCYARQKFVCNSIEGIRPNSKHFCLDSEIVIRLSKDSGCRK